MHYACLVIQTPGGPTVEEQMAPFQEEAEVAPYQRPCECRYSSKAFDQAWEAQDDNGDSLFPELSASFALYTDPADPACQEGCNGTGVVTSTYNPDGRWDWYRIGGRWSGRMLVKDGTPKFLPEKPGWDVPADRPAAASDVAVKERIQIETLDNFHTIIVDGKWHEKPGFSHDAPDKDARERAWDRRCIELIGEAPDKSIFTIVDYHD